MTMRCIALLSGTFLAGFMLAGCATATIEDAVPAGALTQSQVESPAMPTDNMSQAASSTQATQTGTDTNVTVIEPAGTYPNLNVPPATAAPQISAQKKAADRAELRAHQSQIAAEGRRLGVSQDSATLGARARERGAEAQGNVMSDDTDALRRLADRHIEETLKEIEGR